MTPGEAADELREEIEAALVGIGRASAVRVQSVEPPEDLGADTCFQVTIVSERGSGAFDLPTGLAMAYLADEEAAVDEFKLWLQSLLVGRDDVD